MFHVNARWKRYPLFLITTWVACCVAARSTHCIRATTCRSPRRGSHLCQGGPARWRCASRRPAPAQVLTDRGYAASEPDILPGRSFGGAFEGSVNPVGDEVERRAARHGDRFTGMVGQYKDGVWYSGLSPHHPFQVSSGQGPRTGPNMLRPRIQAPMLRNPRAAKS